MRQWLIGLVARLLRRLCWGRCEFIIALKWWYTDESGERVYDDLICGGGHSNIFFEDVRAFVSRSEERLEAAQAEAATTP